MNKNKRYDHWKKIGNSDEEEIDFFKKAQQQETKNTSNMNSTPQQNINYSQNIGQEYNSNIQYNQGNSQMIPPQLQSQMIMQDYGYIQGNNQIMYPMNNGIPMQGYYPQVKQINERELLNQIKNAPIERILEFLNAKMERITMAFNGSHLSISDQIIMYPKITTYSQIPYIDMQKEIDEFEFFVKRYEVKEKIENLLLESQYIKTINEVIFTNFNEYGYWENINRKTKVEKIKLFQEIISLTAFTKFKVEVKWSNNNTMKKIYKNFFKEIEDDIVLNEEFDFKSNGKSLKELVKENPWINFKKYIVNYKTLQVIEKKIYDLNGLKIAVIPSLNEMLPFDSYINVDPLVNRTFDGRLVLQSENEIDKSMLKYICETMFASDREKVKLLLQHLGYCISPNKSKKKALFMIGPANTGKTEIYHLFKSYFPKNLVSGYKLEKLSSDVARHELMNSKINITDESSKKPTSFDTFKTIVSGGTEIYNVANKPKKDFYNIGMVFFANEFIRPLNKIETRDCPTGYLDKFSILITKKLSKAEKYKMTLGKEEFEQKIVFEDTKQIFITMALYELKNLYENDFEFIETQNEIQEKRRHTHNWCQNELKRKRSIEDLIEEFEDYEYSPFESDDIVEGEFQDVDSQDTDFTNLNLDINQPQLTTKLDMYSINSFINDKVKFQDLDIDIAELSSLEFEKIHSTIFNLYKNSRILNDSIFEKYISYVGENNNIFENTKAFIEEFKNELEKRRKVGIINIVKYKKASPSEKKKFGEKDKEIILNVLENGGYILLYKEISYTKENGKSGTKTGFCGLKLK